MATQKKGGAKKPPAKKGAHDALVERLAEQLSLDPSEVVERAVRELAERLDLAAPGSGTRTAGQSAQPERAASAPQRPERAASAPQRPGAVHDALPQRLYLLLDGRGLDGRGMPVEVIDLPATLGSGKSCTIWVNSPQIETRHLQITQGEDGWVLEDLGTEKGTFLGDQRIARRAIRHGDEYRLAGYLRLRTELR